jgi:hypothetical protein
MSQKSSQKEESSTPITLPLHPQGLQQALNVMFEGIRKAQRQGNVYTLHEAAALYNSMMYVSTNADLLSIVNKSSTP